MSFKSKTIIFVSALLAFLFIMEIFKFATADRKDSGARPSPPADGMYLVLRSAPSESSLAPLENGEMLFKLQPNENEGHWLENSALVVLHAEPEVPLLLAKEPSGKYENGELAISVELKEEAREKLLALTSRLESTEVVIVIGNEIVSRHRVREPILDGKLMITCCASSCAYLFERLLSRFQGSLPPSGGFVSSLPDR